MDQNINYNPYFKNYKEEGHIQSKSESTQINNDFSKKNFLNKSNTREHQIKHKNYLPQNEEQNILNNSLDYNNNSTNQNGQDFKLNFKYAQKKIELEKDNENNKENDNNSENENENENDYLIENNLNQNSELYDELDEKLQNLYLKIRRNSNNNENKKKENPISEIPRYINNNLGNYQLNYSNQMTYPNLRRYRQKSEPSQRINPIMDENINNILNINANILRKKNGEKTIRDNRNINTKNSKKVKIPNNLIVKYPLKSENENKNLSELRSLEENIKNENSSQRMISSLLNQENKPEIKNILSQLQKTIKKLPRNEDCKEDNSISTLPPNHLFPFDVYKLQKNNRSNKFKANNNILDMTNNRKIEKIKSKLNDFQEIMNKRPKSKNIYNVEPKDLKEKKILMRNNNRKKSINLFPANNCGFDLFCLEN